MKQAYTLKEISSMTDEQLYEFCAGGESRNNPGKGCHYCLIPIDDENAGFDEIYIENLLDGAIDENGNDDWEDADEIISAVRELVKTAAGETR